VLMGKPTNHRETLTPTRRLKPGMRVAVVAPSGPVKADRLELGCDVLRSFGLEVSLGRHVLDRHPSGYLAGPDTARAADLQEAGCDPDVDAVLCARGGYGAVRILEHLDWELMRKSLLAHPAKPLVGSSDSTALQQAFAHHLGVQTFYGPVLGGPVLGFPDPPSAVIESLRDALFQPEAARSLTGTHALVSGVAEGVIAGGTLSLLCSLVGSDELLPAEGGIALLEDVNESPYRIDRMLTQLLRAGWFRGVAGIACGSWERCGDLDRVDQVLTERLGGLGVPIIAGLEFGHGPVQLTVPLGARARIEGEALLIG
jgi:muramoyltetrapeptide carboxypeptidase